MGRAAEYSGSDPACSKQEMLGDFLGGPVVKTQCSQCGAQVQFLVRELDPKWQN